MSKPSPEIFDPNMFRKSSLSNPSGNCVEVANAGEFIGIRDSKVADSPVLVFTRDEWAAFVGGVRLGEFD